MKSQTNHSAGFSLVELSIVLVIVGFLASAVVMPLSSTLQQARIKQTRVQLESIRQALIGYVISNGRLPCPLGIDSIDGRQSQPANVCSTMQGGVPGVELGVVGSRSVSGALLDAWDREYRYAVSLNDHESHGTIAVPDWLSAGEPRAVGASNLSAELQLCRDTAQANCPRRNLIANQIVWLVLSSGASDSGIGLELENMDNDAVFAVSEYSSNPEQLFNDQIMWGSKSEMVYWLLRAGWFN